MLQPWALWAPSCCPAYCPTFYFISSLHSSAIVAAITWTTSEALPEWLQLGAVRPSPFIRQANKATRHFGWLVEHGWKGRRSRATGSAATNFNQRESRVSRVPVSGHIVWCLVAQAGCDHLTIFMLAGLLCGQHCLADTGTGLLSRGGALMLPNTVRLLADCTVEYKPPRQAQYMYHRK
jgi:hypothetical protein